MEEGEEPCPPTHHMEAMQAKVNSPKKDNRIRIEIRKTHEALLREVSTKEMGWRIWGRKGSSPQRKTLAMPSTCTGETTTWTKSLFGDSSPSGSTTSQAQKTWVAKTC